MHKSDLLFARSESKTYSRLYHFAAVVNTPLPIVHPKYLQDVNLRMDSVLKQVATLQADVMRLRAVEKNSRNLVNGSGAVTRCKADG